MTSKCVARNERTKCSRGRCEAGKHWRSVDCKHWKEEREMKYTNARSVGRAMSILCADICFVSAAASNDWNRAYCMHGMILRTSWGRAARWWWALRTCSRACNTNVSTVIYSSLSQRTCVPTVRCRRGSFAAAAALSLHSFILVARCCSFLSCLPHSTAIVLLSSTMCPASSGGLGENLWSTLEGHHWGYGLVWCPRQWRTSCGLVRSQDYHLESRPKGINLSKWWSCCVESQDLRDSRSARGVNFRSSRAPEMVKALVPGPSPPPCYVVHLILFVHFPFRQQSELECGDCVYRGSRNTPQTIILKIPRHMIHTLLLVTSWKKHPPGHTTSFAALIMSAEKGVRGIW